MATTKIGFLILELEQRAKEVLKLKEKIQKLETEAHATRLQMIQEIKKLDNDKLHTTFQVTHAGKTRLFTIDSNGNIKKENQVIKA
jgi:uncharacterized protein with PhoU and TrkA domain